MMNNATTGGMPFLEAANSSRKDLLVGCALAVGGNLLISVSLNLQKFTHKENETAARPSHYLRKPLWWLGFFLMIVGEAGNFSAYGFAPASLVAPLGSTTVIGCTFAILGAFLLVTFSGKGEYMLTANILLFLMKGTGFIIYVSIELLGLVILLLLRYVFKIINIVVLLLIAALLASFTVISAKAVSGMLQLTATGHMQLHHPIFWIMLIIMIVTAVIQVKYINQAMKKFDSTTVVPTYFVLFTVSAIVAGVVLYKEFMGLGAIKIFMFIFGCFLCFIGVYFITVGRADARQTEDQTTHQAPQIVADFLPSWLFSQVNQAEVQPRQRQYLASQATGINDTEPMLSHISSSSSECINEEDQDSVSTQPVSARA
ncbi:hypothetical protein LSH36_84g08064 [Paralvinella palmiformis]|uniref:NIPA-like protein 2 n=1 Tax=Paralvinella palmiformis TaxID=53620 RepID=A0AAD9NAK8_9ANNE|nr:hypothetical protein LSH36_84g08064 [Paralvinella palmiformis]